MEKTWYVERDRPVAPAQFGSFNSIAQELQKREKTDADAHKRLLIMQLISKRVTHCFIQILKAEDYKHDPQDVITQADIEKIVINNEISDGKIDPEILKFKSVLIAFINEAIPCDFFKTDIYFKVLWPKFLAFRQMYINEDTLVELNKYLDSVEKAALILISDKSCEEKETEFRDLTLSLLTVESPATIKKTFTIAFSNGLKECSEKLKAKADQELVEKQKQQELEKEKAEEKNRLEITGLSADLFILDNELSLLNSLMIKLEQPKQPESPKSSTQETSKENLAVRRAAGQKRKKPAKKKFIALHELRKEQDIKKKQQEELLKQTELEIATKLPDISAQLRAFSRANYSDYEQFAYAFVDLERWRINKQLSSDLEKQYGALQEKIRMLFAQKNYKNVSLEELINKVRKEKQEADAEKQKQKAFALRSSR